MVTIPINLAFSLLSLSNSLDGNCTACNKDNTYQLSQPESRDEFSSVAVSDCSASVVSCFSAFELSPSRAESDDEAPSSPAVPLDSVSSFGHKTDKK